MVQWWLAVNRVGGGWSRAIDTTLMWCLLQIAALGDCGVLFGGGVTQYVIHNIEIANLKPRRGVHNAQLVMSH